VLTGRQVAFGAVSDAREPSPAIVSSSSAPRDPASQTDVDQVVNGELDLDVVMAEIMAEAAQRRRDGTYPPDIERSLAATFARFAPAGALGNDLEALLERLDQAGVIDADVPTESNRPGIPYVKKVVRKSTGWYQRYVAAQVTGFAHITARTLRTLAERVEVVADAHPATSAAVRRFVDGRPITPDDLAVCAAVTAAIIDWRAGQSDPTPPGRWVHIGAAGDEMTRALSSAGIDGYAVRLPNGNTQGLRRAVAIEVRDEDPRRHVARLEPGSIAGAIVTTWLDLAPGGHRVAMIDRLGAVVAPRGAFVVVVTESDALTNRYDPAVLDVLSIDRWSLDTWVEVIRAAGWSTVDYQLVGAGQHMMVAVR
jgi:hypothetical protein